MQHPRLVVRSSQRAGLLGPVRAGQTYRGGQSGYLLRPHGNRLRLCVLFAVALCGARFVSWLALPSSTTKDWAPYPALSPPPWIAQRESAARVQHRDVVVWPSPPPARAPQAVQAPQAQTQTPETAKPRGEPPVASPPPVKATYPADCRTCAVADHLVFNTHAAKLFARIEGRPQRGLFVTFGSLGMQEFIKNWVTQVRLKRLGPFLVGALDDGAAELCESVGIPAVSFGELSMNTTGAYWRTNERTFLAMATLKTELLRGLLSAGWDCMMSDVDVLWFDSPWPWLGANGVAPVAEAAKMAKADVLISTDIVEVETDSIHANWLLNREYNTGIVFFRATNASIQLVKLWRVRCDIEGAIEGLYINDQAVFNRMTHGQASGIVEPLDLLPEQMPDLDPAAVRGVYHVTSPVMADTGQGLRVAMGVLPMQRFCNGHVFFINRLAWRFGLRPVAVHATYQYADEKVYSYGKRHRLRQAQGWHMDPDEYFTTGKYLFIRGESLMAGAPPFVRSKLAVWRGKNHRQNNGIDLHFTMEAHQREMLRDAFALAIATNRTLVLPEMTCFCDRYWWLTHACRMPGAESMPLPIACPLDHLYDIGRWYDNDLAFREAGFLTNSRVPKEISTSRTLLRVTRDDDARGTDAEGDGTTTPSVRVAHGMHLDEVAAALRQSHAGQARVLEVDPLDLTAFCGFSDETLTMGVDARLTAAFSIGINICGEEDNILPLTDWDPVKMPLNCTKGYDPPVSMWQRAKEKLVCKIKGGRHKALV